MRYTVSVHSTQYGEIERYVIEENCNLDGIISTMEDVLIEFYDGTHFAIVEGRRVNYLHYYQWRCPPSTPCPCNVPDCGR